MKVRILLATMAIVGCGVAMAQENRFSAGLELASPMGDFADAAGFGFGVSLGYEIPVGDNLGVFANAGYIMFGGESVDLGPFGKFEYKTSAIPIQVGAKYYFSENQAGFYAGLMVGLHMMTTTADVEFFGISTSTSTSDANLSYAPALGYVVGENIDLQLRYQLISATVETVTPTGGTDSETVTNSYLGLRAAYMFGSR
jgi:hypothetical protein